MNTALIVFVRNPVLGKVKTRIASTLGEDKALSIYTKLLEHTCRVVRSAPAHVFVYYSDVIEPMDMWTDIAHARFVQQGDNLGDRMKNAFQDLFDKGYTRVAIIGSDCFDLTPALLSEAIHCLDQNDFVIGPSEDGGYYLLGMRLFYPVLFNNKIWSTATVCMDTLRDIEKTNYSLYTLPLLSDVDTEEDCLKYNELIN